MVGVAAGEDLRLVFQPAEGAGMDHAIAIPLKRIAIGVRRLGIAASTGILHANGVAGEHGRSLAATRILRQVHVHKKRRRRGSAWVSDRSYCLVAAVCLANFTRVVSSSFCSFTTWSWSTSAGTVLFHSSSERS